MGIDKQDRDKITEKRTLGHIPMSGWEGSRGWEAMLTGAAVRAVRERRQGGKG